MKPIVIQNMYNQFRHSVMQKLTKALLEICDTEFYWVNHMGQSMSRDMLIENISFINYEKWNSSNQTVRFFGECAVLNSEELIVIMNDTLRIPLQTIVTVVFIKRENGWKLVSGQSTPLHKTII